MIKPCKTQCPACPFRHSALPSFLGGVYTAQSIFNSLWRNIPFFCHTKIDYNNPDWQGQALENGRLCLGGLKFANLIGAPLRRGAYPGEEVPVVLELRVQVKDQPGVDVMPPLEFLDWHKPENKDNNLKRLRQQLVDFPRQTITKL